MVFCFTSLKWVVSPEEHLRTTYLNLMLGPMLGLVNRKGAVASLAILLDCGSRNETHPHKIVNFRLDMLSSAGSFLIGFT